MGQILSWASVMERFPADKFIVLLPQVEMNIAHESSMHRLDVSVVKIDPDNKALVYAVETKWNGQKNIPTKVALQKPAIELLAATADISTRAYRVDDGRDPDTRVYGAIALMTTSAGTVRGQEKTREWNAKLERDKIRLRVTQSIDKAIKNRWAKGTVEGRDDGTPLNEQQRADAIETEFLTAWIREQEFGPAKCESKASLRAIRALLALPSGYDPKELRDKSFVVPRWVFEPDMSDPEIKRLVVTAHLNARNMLSPGGIPQQMQLASGTTAPQLAAGNPDVKLEPRVIDASEVVTASAPPAIPDPPATFAEIVPAIAMLIVNFDGPGKEDLLRSYQIAFDNKDYERLTAVWNALHEADGAE